MCQPLSEIKESDLFALFRFQTALDEIDDDATGTGAPAFRQCLNTPRDG